MWHGSGGESGNQQCVADLEVGRKEGFALEMCRWKSCQRPDRGVVEAVGSHCALVGAAGRATGPQRSELHDPARVQACTQGVIAHGEWGLSAEETR